MVLLGSKVQQHRTVSRDKGKGKAMTALAWAQK